MALTVTKNLTDLWDSESTAGWTGITTTLYAGFQREGSNCEGLQVSDEIQTGYRSFTAFNMSSSAVYVWFFTAGQMDTLANGGIGIVLGDGTNRIAYHVGGADSLRFNIGTIWGCLMVDGANPPTSFTVEAGSEAALDFTAITEVGVRFKTLSKSLGGADNCFFDVARWGTGLTITGGGSGTEGTFAEIAADDFSSLAGKAYGIIREIQPGIYGVQGQLTFGDAAAADSYFLDKDAIIVFENNGAGDTLYKLTVQGGTGANSFILGEKVGTGDTALGAKGCTIQSAGPSVDLDLDNASITTHLYGFKLFKINGTVTLSTTVTDEFIGGVVDQCSQIIANQAIIRNCTFSGYTGTASALLWNETINIKNCSFSGNSDITNNPAGVEHPSAVGTPYTYDNLTFSGNDFDVNNSSGLAITINMTNGSDATTSTGSTVTFVNSKSFSFTVSPSIINYEWRLYEVTAIGSLDGAVEKDGEEYATVDNQSYAYTYSADQPIAVQIISQPDEDYEELIRYYTLTNNDQNVTLILTRDDNN